MIIGTRVKSSRLNCPEPRVSWLNTQKPRAIVQLFTEKRSNSASSSWKCGALQVIPMVSSKFEVVITMLIDGSCLLPAALNWFELFTV